MSIRIGTRLASAADIATTPSSRRRYLASTFVISCNKYELLYFEYSDYMSPKKKVGSSLVKLDPYVPNLAMQFSVHGNDPYHRDCYKKLFHPKCEICYHHVSFTFTSLIAMSYKTLIDCNEYCMLIESILIAPSNRMLCSSAAMSLRGALMKFCVVPADTFKCPRADRVSFTPFLESEVLSVT